jgi:hypothetical protein
MGFTVAGYCKSGPIRNFLFVSGYRINNIYWSIGCIDQRSADISFIVPGAHRLAY